MTREEAIVMQKAMRDNLHETGKDYPYRDDMIPLMKESCDIAIKTLEREPCDDCVSRKALIDMATVIETDDYSGNEIMEVVDTNDIRALPPVTPTKCIATVKFSKDDMRELIDEKMKDIVVEHKKGKWIEDYIPLPLSDGSKKCYQCSECRTHWDNVFNYCPNCGCFMSEGGKE